MNLKKIYRQSIKITLKNKALWVIGMALVAFSGGGFNFFQNFSNLSDFSSPEKLKTTNNVANFAPLLEKLKEILAGIPTGTWILLATAVLLAVIIGLLLSLIARSWARGALIGGIDAAYRLEEVTLRSSSERGIKSLKRLLWLSVVPWLLYTLVLLGLGGLAVLLTAIAAPLAIVLGLLAGIFAVIAYFAIAATQIWAERVVVIEGQEAKEAFLEGWFLVKKHIPKMLTLGCLNTLISCCMGCLVVSVFLPAIAFIVGIFTVSPTLGFAFLIPLVLVGLPILLLTLLFNGIYRVFNYSTWNMLYYEVRQGESYE